MCYHQISFPLGTGTPTHTCTLNTDFKETYQVLLCTMIAYYQHHQTAIPTSIYVGFLRSAQNCELSNLYEKSKTL